MGDATQATHCVIKQQLFQIRILLFSVKTRTFFQTNNNITQSISFSHEISYFSLSPSIRSSIRLSRDVPRTDGIHSIIPPVSLTGGVSSQLAVPRRPPEGGIPITSPYCRQLAPLMEEAAAVLGALSACLEFFLSLKAKPSYCTEANSFPLLVSNLVRLADTQSSWP